MLHEYTLLAIISLLSIFVLSYLVRVSIKRCREYETLYIEYRMRWKAAEKSAKDYRCQLVSMKRNERSTNA